MLKGYGVTVELIGSTFIKNGITSNTFKAAARLREHRRSDPRVADFTDPVEEHLPRRHSRARGRQRLISARQGGTIAPGFELSESPYPSDGPARSTHPRTKEHT